MQIIVPQIKRKDNASIMYTTYLNTKPRVYLQIWNYVLNLQGHSEIVGASVLL